MKKITVFFISMLLFTTIINAEEKCVVVNGTGKEIGNEIACGTEHFYIIENKDNNIKMLSKYNLYVGTNFSKIKLDITKTYTKCTYVYDKCNSFLSSYFNGEKIGEGYEGEHDLITKIMEVYGLQELTASSHATSSENNKRALYAYEYSEPYEENGVTYINRTYKLYPYTTITVETEGYALQNEKALGVTGDKGNANYPINATLTLFPNSEISSHVKNFDNFETGYTNFDFKESTDVDDYSDYERIMDVVKYLNDYNSRLSNMGFNVAKVDMMNIKDIDDLVFAISNKRLPLKDWYNASIDKEEEGEKLSKYTNVGDLKEYLPNNYSWLWNTTYWMKTIADNNVASETRSASRRNQVYFVSSAGEICYSESECYMYIPRAGIRPVVTISSENVIFPYNIETQTDGNGQIEVVDKAYENDIITFRITPKSNYKISSITLTDLTGNSITYTEDEIINNNDGTISVNKFTMPGKDVKITAKFEPTIVAAVEETLVNPKTGVFSPLYIMLATLLIGICAYIILCKRHSIDIRI